MVEDTLYDIPGEFVLRLCLNCGLVYLSPRPSQESIAIYYPDQYSSYRPSIEHEQMKIMRWMRQRKLTRRREIIENYSGRLKGDLLDIGCSTGIFLNEMAKSGWDVTGVEPISTAADQARKNYRLSVFEGTLQEIPLEENSFDVVTFWDVLEHTFSPLDQLKKTAQLLRPGGHLFLSVPNWKSPDRQLFGRHWHGYDPPRHLYVFADETLIEMLKEAGFDFVDSLCFMSGYFSSTISVERWLKARSHRLARIVKRLLDFPGVRIPFEPWFMINNKLGRGDVITVVARIRSAKQRSQL